MCIHLTTFSPSNSKIKRKTPSQLDVAAQNLSLNFNFSHKLKFKDKF